MEKFIAVCNYLSGAKSDFDYDFFCDIAVKPGDLVVTDSVRGYGLCKVVGVKTESTSATNWVVDVVDTRAHDARKARERRLAELEAAMEREIKEHQKLERLRAAAADGNDTLKSMLSEYEALKAGPQPQLIAVASKFPPITSGDVAIAADSTPLVTFTSEAYVGENGPVPSESEAAILTGPKSEYVTPSSEAEADEMNHSQQSASGFRWHKDHGWISDRRFRDLERREALARAEHE